MLTVVVLWPQITVHAVAKGMLADYESGVEGVKEWSHGELKKFEATK